MKTNLILDVNTITSVHLRELSNEEIVIIAGGDKFMYDLGAAVAGFFNWLGSSQQIGAPTMDGMS